MNDFLLIADPKIWAMKISECNEPLVDLKDLGFNIVSNRAPYFADCFYEGFTKVRQSVAEKLVQAGKHLPKGISFLFSEGHRPLSLQRQMYEKYYSQLATTNPDWTAEMLKQAAIQFIAPPEDVPPHSTGGAIDITLIDANFRELDMGSPLDAVPDKSENKNFTFTKNISTMAQENRQLLIDALSKVGFVNYPAEWWHWSYGDKYWAYHAGTEAIYSSVE